MPKIPSPIDIDMVRSERIVNKNDQIFELQHNITHITNEIENILGEIRITKKDNYNDYQYIT